MFKSILMTMLLGISTASIAADKALLIGIGDYANTRDLPGIDLDIINMRQTVKMLGFENIRTLENEDATEQNILAHLRWLQEDIGPNDRVLIYFSGHGSQLLDVNGDEPDKLDEFLVAYDFKSTERNGKSYVSGLIVDDTLNEEIKAIKSNNVYVFIDACQSGSATRSLAASGALGMDTVETKFLRYKGMPKQAGVASTGIPMQDKNSGDNFVAISAAQDTEYALAGSNGSYFTLGLMKSVREARARGQNSISPLDLHKEVVNFVHRSTTNKNRYTPVISGSQRLQNAHLRFEKTEQSGEYWQQMATFVQQAGNNLAMRSNKSVYAINEEIVVDIQVPIEGYLNIITVTPNDTPQVLFPNIYMQNNAVKPGLFSTRSLKFDMFASDPKGQNLTIAIITERPMNLYQSSAFSRNKQGEFSEVIAEMDASGLQQTSEMLTRAMSIRAAKDNTTDTMYVGGFITSVK